MEILRTMGRYEEHTVLARRGSLPFKLACQGRHPTPKLRGSVPAKDGSFGFGRVLLELFGSKWGV